MMKPLFQKFVMEEVVDFLANRQYEMIFIYVGNDQDSNAKDRKLLLKAAIPYRPDLNLVEISYSQFIQLSESFILNTLKLSPAQWHDIQHPSSSSSSSSSSSDPPAAQSFLIAVSSQIKSLSSVTSSKQVLFVVVSALYDEFLANHRFGPLVRLDENNFDSVSENCWYLGLVVVSFETEKQRHTSLQFVLSN
ncbi:hypothetical protein RFI_11136 [Reticulomyxa filosa]|uniref:Uncharacterized protein n=1 Tax=Reticulomyxa filosa TaxID=46433 RepID=X6NJV2_RETFI|nr:hypothetical protein RFI_11136 [Reticulomyxa filosa]|eukprot:ETO25999.1 hypothetical protein RFI_11136 [Reticulomyxa filosa]